MARQAGKVSPGADATEFRTYCEAGEAQRVIAVQGVLKDPARRVLGNEARQPRNRLRVLIAVENCAQWDRRNIAAVPHRPKALASSFDFRDLFKPKRVRATK